jgi:hypothetical protein
MISQLDPMIAACKDVCYKEKKYLREKKRLETPEEREWRREEGQSEVKVNILECKQCRKFVTNEKTDLFLGEHCIRTCF